MQPVRTENAPGRFFNGLKRMFAAGSGTCAVICLILLMIPDVSCSAGKASGEEKAARPNIILVMTDDQGWGETGYYGHPALKTPNLDAMAENGLRFDRFYAGAPVCSPTRASVLTGRNNDRTGVVDHGFPLRLQEKTLSKALQQAGYATGHFGKWHLNGVRGPGIPVLASDKRHPGVFGFDEWLSVTNFFDRDPVLGRKGVYEPHVGDSSEVVVAEALKFMGEIVQGEKPFLTVIWFGTPHSPFQASDEDCAPFQDLGDREQRHYGELVAMDRSIGTLRRGLLDLGVAKNTLVWFCSDNGGLSGLEPDTVGGLRGHKGSFFEGGLRVPAVIEWPEAITNPRVTAYPASTMDIFPTLAEVVGLPADALPSVCDGISIRPVFDGEIGTREKPVFFHHQGRVAMVDNDYKLMTESVEEGKFMLYDLKADKAETTDLASERPEVFSRMKKVLEDWMASVEKSIAGEDYPGGFKPDEIDGIRKKWRSVPEYQSAWDAYQKEKEAAKKK